MQISALDETIADRDRMLGVITGYGRGELSQGELPRDVHTYPGRIVEATARIDELRLRQQQSAVIGQEEPGLRPVSGPELMDQEHSVSADPAPQWTLQQQSMNAAGEAWFVLEKRDESGELRIVSGTREELDKVIAEHGLHPLELPPVSERMYYREAIGGAECAPETQCEESLGLSV